ncbi:MAG TPA: SUMF1/EgtB/PvdO family nonheme iron enzyme [Polyangiaceae bacterium]|nr:SUMF1/EgtB/PvdO family nonheme iron enzyme [Polyangiaceae bacterium]
MRFAKYTVLLSALGLTGLGCKSDLDLPSSALELRLQLPEGALAAPPAVSASPTHEERSAEFLTRSRGDLAPAADGPDGCPDDMVLVEGDYCPNVEQRCLRYLDPPGRYEQFRCAEYAKPVCRSKERKRLRYCIDRDEYAEPGEHLPANHRSFTHAEKACGSLGKRVCLESEWNFACEGEEMLPYPYGLSRDPSACNADRTDILTSGGELRDLRAPAGAYPRCVSPFGVRNLSGNLEEFVAMDGPGPARPAMKGAYWQPSRNFCRAAQTAHDRYYNGTETGFRCCADPGGD